MEPLIVLAERNVIFHGIWVAGFRVTDKLVKSIGLDLDSKPSRPCKLLLTSAGMTLEILPSADGKTGKTDQVPFQDLRDITINPYNTKCLMIVYVDAKSSNFSIMACSSQEERHLSAICGAYKDRKNFLLQTQQNRSSGQEPLNWTLRQKHRNSVDGQQALPNAGPVPYINGTYVRANQAGPQRIVNGFVPPAGVAANGGAALSYRHFSDGSDNLEDDAFLEETVVQVHHADEELEREPVDGSDAYNVGVQTLHSGDESDAESIRSNSSFRSLRDDIYTLSEEMKAIKFLLETSTGISAEEYYRRRDIQGNRHAVAFHTVPKVKFTGEQEGTNSETDNTDQQTNGAELSSNENDNNNNVKDDEDDYDLRSIGAQTDKSKMNQRRYARKPMNVSIANANKEKVAAVRKRSSNSSVTSPGGPNSLGGGGGSISGGSGSFSEVPRSPSGVSQRSLVSSYSYQSSSVVPPGKLNSKPPKKSPVITYPSSSSTVVRPIESVYQGRKPRRSNSATSYGSSRKRIVFMAAPKAI